LNVYELQKAMIAAGVAGSHWEDQLASEKKCGHLGGKVLIPTQQHIRTLTWPAWRPTWPTFPPSSSPVPMPRPRR